MPFTRTLKFYLGYFKDAVENQGVLSKSMYPLND